MAAGIPPKGKRQVEINRGMKKHEPGTETALSWGYFSSVEFHNTFLDVLTKWPNWSNQVFFHFKANVVFKNNSQEQQL